MKAALHNKSTAALLTALTALVPASGVARAEVLADNLNNATAGVEAASTNRRLAGSFANGAATRYLSSITLLLANPTAGAAALDLYSDGNLEPGALLHTLTSPGGYSGTLAAATFGGGAFALQPNTTYWVVLRVQGGAFEWAWTANNAGTGTGFRTPWGVSEDAGASWYTYDVYPMQFAVTVTSQPCAGDADGSGRVDQDDLDIALFYFGTAQPAGTNGDVDGNGVVNQDDLDYVLFYFGCGS